MSRRSRPLGWAAGFLLLWEVKGQNLTEPAYEARFERTEKSIAELTVVADKILQVQALQGGKLQLVRAILATISQERLKTRMDEPACAQKVDETKAKMLLLSRFVDDWIRENRDKRSGHPTPGSPPV